MVGVIHLSSVILHNWMLPSHQHAELYMTQAASRAKMYDLLQTPTFPPLQFFFFLLGVLCVVVKRVRSARRGVDIVIITVRKSRGAIDPCEAV